MFHKIPNYNIKMAEVPSLTTWTELLPLQPKSLIVLDIDETFLCFPTTTEDWWKELHRTLRAKHGPEQLHILAKLEWERVVCNELPMLTDTIGFQRLDEEIRKTNSKLIFLTARLDSLAPLTRRHLLHCGVSADVEVHYSQNNGETLHSIIARNPHCTNFIFVDNKVSNIYNVKYHNPIVKVYQWVKG